MSTIKTILIEDQISDHGGQVYRVTIDGIMVGRIEELSTGWIFLPRSCNVPPMKSSSFDDLVREIYWKG